MLTHALPQNITEYELLLHQINAAHRIRCAYTHILLFYIDGVTLIGLLVSYMHLDLKLSLAATGSPFSVANEKEDIKGLSSVTNAALLMSARSATSSEMYTSSCALCMSSLSECRFLETGK